jgi:ABC-2 type transport system ATP-binding protein
MNPLVSVSHLIKRYAKAAENAVDDISFSIDRGHLFALLGPNGAGKTTTLSILTTTLAKTAGTITIAGYDIDKQAALVRQNIGVIFQNPSLDQNLTAEENVRFHAVLYGLYPFSPTFSLMPPAYRKTVTELAGILDIQSEIFKPIKTFSGGMKRKLEIIRGLMHHPKILFLDEPTTGLDPLSRKNLWEYLQGIRKSEKTTLFLTTHYLEEAENADNVCIINHGRIVAQGTAATIKRQLIEDYLMVDAKNRQQLKEELKKLHYPVSGDFPLKIPLDGKTAQEIIQSIRTPLSRLSIHSPTLEQAYLEIIDKSTTIEDRK